MIIGKNFFISEMPKTGTTFLRSYFKKHKNIKLTMHHDTGEVNLTYNLLKKGYRISTIRSPYTWYLSFWRWSCIKKKKSPLYSDLTSRRLKIKRYKFSFKSIPFFVTQITKNINNLKILFSDVNSKDNFNKFLTIMLNTKYKNYISSDYSFINNENLGYMSFFFITQNVLIKDYKILYNSNKNLNNILKIIDSKVYTNQYFKTENLTNDLKKFLEKNKFKIKKLNNTEKNSTSSKSENYLKFFNKKNLKLIEKKEKYLFEKFNYKKLSNEI